MTLSIIIPVFNEEETLEEVLNRVSAAPVFDYRKEIIVVDDGSTDGTRELLERLRGKFNFVHLRHPANFGKGRAIQTGLEKVSGQLVLIQDADLEYNPLNYQDLLKIFKKNNSVVYGSRNIAPKRRGYFHYVLGVWFLTTFVNLLFGSKLTDVYTCYKLFPADSIRSIPLESNGFEFEAEITAKLLSRGHQIKEVPIDYNPRRFKEGKKIRFKDGLKGLWTILRCRLESKSN
jgi:glycosyltransferase involved in cell wall biosynthesis